VGLRVTASAHAIVFSENEKSQIPNRNRAQPGLPTKKGRVGTITHESRRHGTTTLFAAREVFGGTVIESNTQGPRHREFIRFLKMIEAAPPADNLVHVMLNSDAAHKRLLPYSLQSHHFCNDGHGADPK
jgi:hypothetical protein